jgi:hypothetical protein
LLDQLVVRGVGGGADGRNRGAQVRGLCSANRHGGEDNGGGKQVRCVHGGSGAVKGPRMLGAQAAGSATDT